MRARKLHLLGLGGLVLLLTCQAAPPDMEHALTLYREGRISHARREMVLYARAYPFNEEIDLARQHILLIRRIKQMEHTAVQQWLQGDSAGTRRTIGVLRFLHPAYVDSADIFRILKLDRPPRERNPALAALELPEFDMDDSTLQRLIPTSLATLNSQQAVIIHIARAWEVIKNQDRDGLIQELAHFLSAPETLGLLQAVDTAYLELRAVGSQSTPLMQELRHVTDQFDRFLVDLQAAAPGSLLVFEYDFHGSKRELLQQILAIKARLGVGATRVG
ncbi:MAG: hypothetical protein IID14_06290 [Candidatus Marinimicrobia bacterium]|nr:hypothetical protein [Candidatus Neomarinimicrobiota bacterium]